MSKSLSNFIFIMLFLAPSCLFGMDSEIESLQSEVKIQTSDEAEFTIALEIANQSETLKKMIEDIGELAGSELPIPLPQVSKKQFELLLPAMQELAKLSMAELQASKKELARQLQKLVANLKSNEQPLSNQQLIELVAGANYLDVPFGEPALQALARRVLNKKEWLRLEFLGDKLQALWRVHPAMKVMLEGTLPRQYHRVKGIGFIKSLDDKKSISWHSTRGTISIRGENKLEEPITLQHPELDYVIETLDGKGLISWSFFYGNIKIWDKNNLTAEPITLKHRKLDHVIESEDGNNLISWSYAYGTIKIWDKNNLKAEPITTFPHPWAIENKDGKSLFSWLGLLNPTPDQILLLLAVYFVGALDEQQFNLPAERRSKLKATFNTLAPTTQAFLEKQAPHFIAAIKSVQK